MGDHSTGEDGHKTQKRDALRIFRVSQIMDVFSLSRSQTSIPHAPGQTNPRAPDRGKAPAPSPRTVFRNAGASFAAVLRPSSRKGTIGGWDGAKGDKA